MQIHFPEKLRLSVNQGLIRTGAPDGKTVLNQDLLITVFDTGLVEIPAQPFAFQNGPDQDTLFTRPVALQIRSLPVDTTIRDIKANMRTPVNAQEVFPYFLALVGTGPADHSHCFYCEKNPEKR